MRRLRFAWLVPFSGLLLLAAEPFWKTKPIATWTEQDARLILEKSPWAKLVVAGVTRRESEDERRAGGNMGQPHGVGYDGVDDHRVRPTLPGSLIGSAPTPPPVRTQLIRVLVRWETALPVRAAELKTREADPPTLEGDGYKVAVYGIPASYVKGDPKSLGEPLKNLAFLRREGKKDVKPTSVEVFQLEKSLVVVYLFPLSAEISTTDASVEFSALIGRLQITEAFDIGEMQFQGKLEL
jgi:hypothetical protein